MLWCQRGLRCCGAKTVCDIVLPKQLERGIPADSSMDTPCFFVCMFVPVGNGNTCHSICGGQPKLISAVRCRDYRSPFLPG